MLPQNQRHSSWQGPAPPVPTCPMGALGTAAQPPPGTGSPPLTLQAASHAATSCSLPGPRAASSSFVTLKERTVSCRDCRTWGQELCCGGAVWHRAPGARSPSWRDPSRGTGPPPAARPYLPAAVVPGLQQVVQEQAAGWGKRGLGQRPEEQRGAAGAGLHGRGAEPTVPWPSSQSQQGDQPAGHGGPREGPVVTVAVPHSPCSTWLCSCSRALPETRPSSPTWLCHEPRSSHASALASWAGGNRLLAGTARLATGFPRQAGIVHQHPCTQQPAWRGHEEALTLPNVQEHRMPQAPTWTGRGAWCRAASRR